MGLTDTSFVVVAKGTLDGLDCPSRPTFFPQNESMSQASSGSIHSISSHPEWGVNCDKNVEVDEDSSPLLNQPEAAERREAEGREAAVEPTLGFRNGDCAQLCRQSDNSKSLLLIVSFGLASLQGPDRCLGDADVEPYKSFKPRNKICSSNKEMAAEVARRATVMNIKEKGKPPKPSNWAAKKLVDWLRQCPRLDRDDIAFLRQAEFALCTALSSAAAETAEQKENTKRQVWTGNEPCLRLCLCATDDKTRDASLTKDILLNRPELDARNNENRPKTFEEVVTELFNDETFTPHTEALPNLSSTFAEPIELPFSLMPGPIAPEQVKSKLADSRVKLMNIVNRWERSGNGFGQQRDEEGEHENPIDYQNPAEDDDDCDVEDDRTNKRGVDVEQDVGDNFGHLIDENFMDGDNRQSFVWCSESEKDHHLHWWHVLDSQGVLSKVINKLDRTVAVDCDSQLPDVTQVGHRGEKRKQGKDQSVKEDVAFRTEVGGALSGLTYQAMIENRDRVRRTANSLKVQKLSEPDQEIKEELATMVDETQRDLDQIEEQMLDYERKFKLKQKKTQL